MAEPRITFNVEAYVVQPAPLARPALVMVMYASQLEGSDDIHRI